MDSIWWKVLIGLVVLIEWVLMSLALLLVIGTIAGWATGACTGITCW